VPKSRIQTILGDERGAVAVFVALGMIVFLGSAAIAIDIGHLMNVRTESQRVADLSALAGASAFVDVTGPTIQSTAEQRAQLFASLNTVDKASVSLPVSDINVDIANERVRVTIRNSAATGNPITTIFAKVLGIYDVDVVTTAVAEAFPAAGANCILPFMLPDRYQELGGDPTRYDGDPPDYYEPFDASLNPPSPTTTGYTEADKGLRLVIKPSQGNVPGKPNPSWYYPIVLFDTGGNAYSNAISGCVNPDVIFTIGDVVQVEPGAMIGPTSQGVKEAIAKAPTHEWNDSQKCVVDAAVDANLCVGGSPRLRPVPMMAPYDVPGAGRKNVTIRNWAGVFLERMQGNDVVVRFAGYSGVAPIAGGPGGGAGALPKIIRLVE